MFPVVLGHLPGGCNAKQPQHYMQLQASDRFCQYDYDPKENQRIYGRSSPPEYRLEKITAPVALYYGSNDYFAAVEDVKRLAKLLPNVVDSYLFKKWNHMDMIWGVSARRTIQPRMLKLMQYWETHGGAEEDKTEAPPAANEEEATTELVLETTTTTTPEETTQSSGVVEEKDDIQATEQGINEELEESMDETTYSPGDE